MWGARAAGGWHAWTARLDGMAALVGALVCGWRSADDDVHMKHARHRVRVRVVRRLSLCKLVCCASERGREVRLQADAWRVSGAGSASAPLQVGDSDARSATIGDRVRVSRDERERDERESGWEDRWACLVRSVAESVAGKAVETV